MIDTFECTFYAWCVGSILTCITLLEVSTAPQGTDINEKNISKLINSIDKIALKKFVCNSFDIFLGAWWSHQMVTFSMLLTLCAGNSLSTSEFPSQRPVTQSFNVSFDLCLNKRLGKQLRRWWSETPSCSLHHCNGRWVNTLRLRQNGRYFADDFFKCIFLNGNFLIPIKSSLKFVPKGPINNIPALAQIIAWRRPGDKPLSEPMMVSLLTQICVTRPQWVKESSLDPSLKHVAC